MIKIFLISSIGAAIFTWIAIRAARFLGVLDYPEERKIHSKPMPLLGGAAVFAAFSLALLLNFRFSLGLKGVVIGASIVMVAGLIDDMRGLSARIRLLVQVVCSLIVVLCGVRIRLLPGASNIGLVLEYVITVIWIVGVTNALNFLDGADGLAAGITFIASTAFFAIAYQTGQVYFAFLNVALAGSCLGFLVFNFHPARIFLGDAGSSFLGFSLASLAVMGEWAENEPIVALSIPLLILAVPIFDIVYITISRMLQGKVSNFREWIEYVGKDHLHHRLSNMGFSHRQTVVFIYLVCSVFAIAALVLKKATVAQSVLLVSQGVMILVIVSVLMLVGQENIEKRRLKEMCPGDVKKKDRG